MGTYIGHQEAVSAAEFEELAYGIDRELFLGSPGESPEERAARLDAARDVLDDLRAQGESDEVAAWDALYAEQLTYTAPLLQAADRTTQKARWSGEAA